MNAAAAIASLALLASLDGEGVANQAPAIPMPLEGSGWTVARLAGRTLLPHSSLTLTFDAGHVSGTDGCNAYSGVYLAKGSSMRLSELASTQMACPAELMAQAGAFTDALADVRSYRVASGQLELIGPDGSVRAVLVAQSRELEGTTWHATGINNGAGGVASLAQNTEVTLSFGADGRATGSAGCNRYFAGYVLEGSRLKFSPPAATRRMCAEAGVMEQERAYLKALESVATARIEADRLVLRTSSDAMAASFARAPTP